MKTVLKIGQEARITADVEFAAALSGTKKVIKAGTRFWIGPGKLVHYQNGMIQPISEDDFEIKGYDTEGLANWLWLNIRQNTCVDENTLAEYDVTPEAFKKALEFALEELGF